MRAVAGPPLDARWRAALWALLVVFSLAGVFGHSLWGPNETREGGMIWDMDQHGTLVVPTIDGRPFLEKPPLLHWTGVALCRLFGRCTEGLVRLPAALYGFGTLALLVLLLRGPRLAGGGRDRHRELAAWSAAFMCGTAIEFLEYARVVLTDMALVFTVMLALLLFWRASEKPSTGRWLAFLLAASGSFYAKGLIGPVLIWSAVTLFLLWQKRWRRLAGLAAAYLPVVVAVVLPWALALLRFGGEPALRFFFWDNQIGRFFHFHDVALPHDPFFINKEPWYYYPVQLPLYLAPWTPLLLAALVAWVRRSSPFRAPLHAFLASSVAGMALVLQASSAKVASYALPLYPFLFGGAALWLIEVLACERPAWLDRWSVRATGAVIGAATACVPLVFVVGTVLRPRLFRTGGPVATAAALALALVLLVFVAAAALALVRLARSPARSWIGVLGPAGYALFIALGFVLVTPAIDRSRSYRPVADVAADEVDHGVTVALGTEEYRDVGAFTFYLDERLPLLASGDAAAFLDSDRPRAVIVPRSHLAAFEAQLAGIPYGRLVAGERGTLSRAFVVMTNAAEQVAMRRAPSPIGREILARSDGSWRRHPPAGGVRGLATGGASIRGPGSS